MLDDSGSFSTARPRLFPNMRGVLCSLIVIVGGGLSLGTSLGATPSSFDANVFTVLDGIEMVRVVGASSDGDPLPKSIVFSPNQEHFTVVTRRGNVSTGNTEYQLLLFSTDEVSSYVNSKKTGTNTSCNCHKVIASLASDSNLPAISNARWPDDNRTLMFIGVSVDEPRAQIYRVDIHQLQQTQLTDHPTSIVTFDISANQSQITFVALGPPLFDPDRDSVAFQVANRSYLEATDIRKSWQERGSVLTYQYFVLQLDSSGPPKSVGELFYYGDRPRVWSSPSGRWAIGLQSPQSIPASWITDYPLIGERYRARVEEAASITYGFQQYVLVDTKAGTAQPVWNVPNGWIAGGDDQVAHWTSDDTVILTQTYLPVNVPNRKEKELRREYSAIVEVNVNTGAIDRIATLVRPDQTAEDQATVQIQDMVGSELTTDGVLVIHGRYNKNGSRSTRYFAKRRRNDDSQTNGGSSWEEVAHVQNGDSEGINFSVDQDLNEAPHIVVTDPHTNRAKSLLGLASQFDNVLLGKVERTSWLDQSGSRWSGALVYPPYYSPHRRYPLVIQTHGFSENEFLIDGPGGSPGAYSARALASKDIIVLQMQDVRGERAGGPEEFQALEIGIESAVEHLAGEGIVDKSRVGIIGFSSTGYLLSSILTSIDIDVAAASLADSGVMDFYAYITMLGTSTMSRIEEMLGGQPWGESQERWISNSPIFRSDNISTPIRFESYGSNLLGFWDLYAVLKRQDKPVEFFIFPTGEHVLRKPTEIFVSQQGNVDWFDFWLNDRERTEPYPGTPETKESLAEQNQRWRKLQELQPDSKANAIKARAWYKEEAARRQAADAWSQTEEGKRAAMELLEPANAGGSE